MSLTEVEDEIINIRCCLSGKFEKIVDKELIGADCKFIERDKHRFRIRQMFLDKLMCIDYDRVEMECLTESQISDIAESLLSFCKTC